MPKRYAQVQVRKRIELEPQQQGIVKLCLDQIEIVKISITIKRLLESCINLQYFTMNACHLLSLQFFPSLPNLISLQMTDNELRGQDLMKLSLCKQVSFLSLANNRIENITYLSSLSQLKQLQVLIVVNNPLVESNNYRQQIFDQLPQLKTVDCYDCDDRLLDSEGEDSYITNKYRSFQNLEDMPSYQINNHSQKEPKDLAEQDRELKRQRGHYNNSDDSSQDEMMNQFRRKMNKQE